MASVFDELGALDRPFCNIKISLGGKDISALGRMPSAEEQDMIDHFFNEEYARILEEKLSSKDGVQSELERIRRLYNVRPKSDLVDQMLGVRTQEITKRAYDLMGVDYESEAEKMAKMSEDERTAYVHEQDEILKGFVKQARELEKQDLEAADFNSLVDQLSTYNINLKSVVQARRAVSTWSVYYSLYTDKDPVSGATIAPKRVFESMEAVRKNLTAETIDKIVEALREGFRETAALPFKSQVEAERAKLSQSPSTSAAATETSGEPIETTPEN